MLKFLDISGKTYEERMADAITRIPIYSSEWTNFNPSDPGITILENLSLFETLQQNHISEMTPEVKALLLKMAGFTPAKGRQSRVLLSCKGLKEPLSIPRGKVFKVGELSFETMKNYVINNCHVIAIYGKTDDEITDFSYVLDKEMDLPAKILGENPVKGRELYFICNALPDEGEDAIFYFEFKENSNRNIFEDRATDLFGKISWEIYTDEGFIPVHTKDNTGAFMVSGEFHLRIPSANLAVYEEGKYRGYCFKAVLDEAAYDISPELLTMYDFLFEVWQQETKSFSYSGSKASSMEMLKELISDNYISVFGKEGKNSSYHQYLPTSVKDLNGRYFELEENDETAIYHFSKARHGYAPVKGRAAVRIIGYSEEIMRNYKLGIVEGYDNQKVQLPISNIVPDTFFVIAKRKDEEGENIYDFVRPGHNEDGDLYYVLHEREGIIEIREAGDFIGAELLMGGCATFLGEKGNIRKKNIFKTTRVPKGVTFFNPENGTGGLFTENLESVRMRFVNDIETPFVAVTEADYEYIVRTTPGLCIQKAKAYIDYAKNEAQIAVLPGTLGSNGFPVLSKEYIDRITRRLEERKLLTTRVAVKKPVYVPINVRATVYVKQHFENCEEVIRKAVEEATNYLVSKKNFGDVLHFEDVFRTIELLPCVEYVYQLALRPAKHNQATVKDEDVFPVMNGLVVPGNISLEIVTYRERKQ